MTDADRDLDALCRTARLDLDPAARARLGDRLRRITEAFASLAALELGPDDSAPPAPLRLRADEPGPCLPVERALGNAARTAADCFVVPRVVEGSA